MAEEKTHNRLTQNQWYALQAEFSLTDAHATAIDVSGVGASLLLARGRIRYLEADVALKSALIEHQKAIDAERRALDLFNKASGRVGDTLAAYHEAEKALRAAEFSGDGA